MIAGIFDAVNYAVNTAGAIKKRRKSVPNIKPLEEIAKGIFSIIQYFFKLYIRKSPQGKFLILAKRIDAASWMKFAGDIILRGQPLKIRAEWGLLLLLENYSCYFLQIALQKNQNNRILT
ncbi:MAG: hypothetical protein KID04_10435 [Clostridium sp.]|nr:hypothetical protein [Clostridium sp.]